LQVQGNTLELRNRERNALDETNRAIYDQITALQDQQAANQAAAQAAEQAAQAIARAAEAQRNAIQTTRSNTDAAYAALERAVNAQKRAATVTRDVAQQQVSSINSIMDVLAGGIRNLFEGTREAAFQGMSFIDRALGTARSTGYLPDSQQLQQAITGATQGVTGRTFATKADQIEAQRLLAFKLRDLQDVAGDQLTEAERQLQVSNKQLESLDAILENARAQIDALRGVDNSVMSVADAISRLNFASTAERAASSSASSAPTIDQMVTSAYASIGRAGLGSSANNVDQAGFNYWTTQLATGAISPADFSNSFSSAVSEYIKTNPSDPVSTYVKEIRGFANGGYHTGGIRLVGERGPELEVTGPARIFNAQQTADMLRASAAPVSAQGRSSQGDPALRQLVADLTTEVANLRVEARASALASQDHLQLTRRMTRNGQSMPITGVQNDAIKVEVAA
jgi:hypothetical protein